MLKNISNLGKALSKAGQKEIFGGKVASIHRCCIKVPGQNPPPGCNSSPACVGHLCGCS